MTDADWPRPAGLLVLDCGADEAEAQVRALAALARQLGAEPETEQVSAGCTALTVRLGPAEAARFRAALLLGGATLLQADPGTDALVVLVTMCARRNP